MSVKLALAAAAALCVAGPAATQDLQKSFTNLSEVQWQKKDGREFALIMGAPDKPGPYILLLKQPPNARTEPHTHPDARVVTVLTGKYWVGYGEKFDESTMHMGTTGTVFTEPARTAHYGRAKEEGAILQFYGIGPTEVNFLETAKPAAK
jgi:quercetin dioxygenase-like cupin family protein